jgi:hypothetical protein
MVRSVWLVVIVGLLGEASAAPAPETYTIKLKENGPGERTVEDRQSNNTSTVQVLDADGKALKTQEDNETETFVYEETTLEKAKGQQKPTRLRRHYDKAQVTTGKKIQTLPYQGKTILIEKKDGAYHFQVVGGEELSGKAALRLQKEFNDKKHNGPDWAHLLPRQPIADFEEGSPFKIDAARAKATGRLLRAYKQNGHRFGVMELTLQFPIKTFNAAGQKIDTEAGSGMVLKATIDACIDGSVSTGAAKFTMKMDLAAVVPDNNTKLIVHMDMTGTDSTRELPKKPEAKEK